MSAQLHHLLRVGVRPNVTIRVLADKTGFHAGKGPFILFTFGKISPVAFLEGDGFTVFLEQKDEVSGYEKILKALADAALSEGQSRDMITRLAASLGGHREDPDDCTTDLA